MSELREVINANKGEFAGIASGEVMLTRIHGTNKYDLMIWLGEQYVNSLILSAAELNDIIKTYDVLRKPTKPMLVPK